MQDQADAAEPPSPALLQFWSKFKVPAAVPVATPARARSTDAVGVDTVASTLPDVESYHPDNQLGLVSSPSPSPSPLMVRSSGPAPAEPDPPLHGRAPAEAAPSLPPSTPVRGSEVSGTPSGPVALALTRATTVDLLSPSAPPGSVASQKLEDVDAAVQNSVLKPQSL